MTLTNITVKDLGDIVEAEYELTGGTGTYCANITQMIERYVLLGHVIDNMIISDDMKAFCQSFGFVVVPDDYLRDNPTKVVESYLKQNLK